MEDVKRIVQKLLICIGHEAQIEVEARIRGPIVNDISVRRLLSYGEWDTLEYTEQKRISKTNRKCTYRYRQYTKRLPSEDPTFTSFIHNEPTGSNPFPQGVLTCWSPLGRDRRKHEIICKSSLMVTDVADSWCTVHVSTEMPMPSMLQSLQTVKANNITRYRRVINDHFVDVTDDGEVKRVEIEVPNGTFDGDALITTVIEVCRVMQDSAVMVGRLDWTSLMHIVSTTYSTFCLDTQSYQKPITMTSSDLWKVLRETQDYLVTPKIDGVRQFILIMGDKAYSIDLTKNIRYLCDITNDYRNPVPTLEDYDDSIIILDCEYQEATVNKYYIIDIVVFNGKYIGNVPFSTRQTLIQGVLRVALSALSAPNIVSKPYNTFNSFQQLIQIYNCWLNEYNIDGLIFVHENKPYMQQVLKWKNDSTVDLEVVNNTNGYALMTCDGLSIDIPLVLQPTTSFEFSGIWEFKYKESPRGPFLTPSRPRPDKPQANSYYIVTKNIKESVPGSIFDGTGCFMMRKYHNRVKTGMLHPVHGTILDIGTGQGGDISKWKDATSVYCVEPDADAIQEMKNRLLESPKQNIYVNNCLLRDLDPDDIPVKISIFAAFFCVNQWNIDDWTKLVKIIQTKGTKRCRFVTTALTHPQAGKNTCWELNIPEGGRYNISIHNTRITNINETALSIKMLDERMKECNMTRAQSWRLNTSDAMTHYEMQLSSMYTAITYQRGHVTPITDTCF